MCGIAGFAGWSLPYPEAEETLARMCGAILHRGPDEDGYYVAPGVGLGMRRLSIIDVAGGKQPIGNEDGSVQVVFNGEIYNHRQLQTELEARGHRFVSHCDTETLVHLYEERGETLVHALRGMFGFALWDSSRQKLLLARDRIGIKPLYYWTTEDGIAFASELRALIALDRFPRDIDPAAVAHYLAFGYVPDPLAIFRGVRKLPPGHVLSWDPTNGARVEEYWRPEAPEERALDERNATEELRRLLEDAVASHLESEVPLGAFLSGGIDSSTVVALMARQLERPVRTFSIGFDEQEFNEAPHAAAVARALRTEHTEFILRPEADALIEEVVRAFDEPFADSSALPTYLVAQLARRHVTVALSGDGGDELFGGYTRYGELLGRTEVGSRPARHALRSVARTLPHIAPGRNRLLDLARSRRGRYASTVAMELDPRDGGVARPEVVGAAQSLEELLEPWFRRAAGRDLPTQLMLVDMMTYLPGDILTKVDRATMASSLEARVPLLDHPLIEFAVSLPSSLKMRDGTGKWILRRVAAELVPPEVLQRPKQGFAVPLGRWFRSDLSARLDALLREDAPVREWVQPEAVRRVVREHRIGRRDHAYLLWRLVALDIWLRCLAAGDLGRPSRGNVAAMLVDARSG